MCGPKSMQGEEGLHSYGTRALSRQEVDKSTLKLRLELGSRRFLAKCTHRVEHGYWSEGGLSEPVGQKVDADFAYYRAHCTCRLEHGYWSEGGLITPVGQKVNADFA
eukprot:scaffold219676_cov17-Tisochrysis_lutea.AAC.1